MGTVQTYPPYSCVRRQRRVALSGELDELASATGAAAPHAPANPVAAPSTLTTPVAYCPVHFLGCLRILVGARRRSHPHTTAMVL